MQRLFHLRLHDKQYHLALRAVPGTPQFALFNEELDLLALGEAELHGPITLRGTKFGEAPEFAALELFLRQNMPPEDRIFMETLCVVGEDSQAASLA